MLRFRMILSVIPWCKSAYGLHVVPAAGNCYEKTLKKSVVY